MDDRGAEAGGAASFFADEPFWRAGFFEDVEVSPWRCALRHAPSALAGRTGLEEFFIHAVAKPGMTQAREALLAEHRAYLAPHDRAHCVARGPLTDPSGREWLGSALGYAFPDRAALDAFLGAEPYRRRGLYARVDVYAWSPGAASGGAAP